MVSLWKRVKTAIMGERNHVRDSEVMELLRETFPSFTKEQHAELAAQMADYLGRGNTMAQVMSHLASGQWLLHDLLTAMSQPQPVVSFNEVCVCRNQECPENGTIGHGLPYVDSPLCPTCGRMRDSVHIGIADYVNVCRNPECPMDVIGPAGQEPCCPWCLKPASDSGHGRSDGNP